MSRLKTKEKLLQRGWEFDFFAAVKMLEDINPDAPKIGSSGPAGQEMIRIRPNSELSFPPGDVRKIKLVSTEDGKQHWEIFENFMGLYGTNSPLPPFVSDMIAQNYRDEDPLRDFLDIFNHRALSLYYKTWKKYNPAASFSPEYDDAVTMVLYSMLGYHDDAPREEWVIPPERLIPYAGRLAGGGQSVSGLEVIIDDFFGLEGTQIEQFIPRKVKLPAGDCNRLGSITHNNSIGDNLVLGDEIQDVCGQFKITLGPLSFTEFRKFQPGEPAFRELVFLVRLYTKNQLEFEIDLLVDSDDAGSMLISSMVDRNALGRTSWIGKSKKKTRSVALSPNIAPSVDHYHKKTKQNLDVELVLTNSLSDLDKIHDGVADLADRYCLPPKISFNLSLVIEELVVNTINYGFDDAKEHPILLRMWAESEWIHVQLEDDGRAFNPLCDSPEPMLDLAMNQRQIGGVGIHLTRKLMDDIKYQRFNGRNVVTLSKRRNNE